MNYRNTKNLKVKNALVENRVYLYELADALNFSEATMSRRLRYELPDEEQERYVSIIKEIGGR